MQTCLITGVQMTDLLGSLWEKLMQYVFLEIELTRLKIVTDHDVITLGKLVTDF